MAKKKRRPPSLAEMLETLKSERRLAKNRALRAAFSKPKTKPSVAPKSPPTVEQPSVPNVGERVSPSELWEGDRVVFLPIDGDDTAAAFGSQLCAQTARVTTRTGNRRFGTVTLDWEHMHGQGQTVINWDQPQQVAAKRFILLERIYSDEDDAPRVKKLSTKALGKIVDKERLRLLTQTVEHPKRVLDRRKP